MKAVWLALLGLSIAAPAYAGRIAEKKKWALDEIQSPNSSQVMCVAATSIKEGKSTYTLEVHKVKGVVSSPVEVLVREIGLQQVGPVVYGAVGAERVLVNEFQVVGDQKFFWYLPDESRLLVHQLKTGSEMDLKPLYASKIEDLDFSLDGAATILQTMERHCNNGLALVNDRLALLTDHPAAFDAAPKALAAASIVQMRELYRLMGAQLQQILDIEKEIEVLVARYRPSIDERSQLSTERNSLVGSVIPGIKNDQVATTNRLNQTRLRLQQLKTEIPQAQTSLSQAQAAFDQAEAKIAPHVPKHNQLVAALNQASSDLDSAESSLASVVRELQNNESKIRSLDIEARDLGLRIDSIRRELSYAQSEMDRAQRNYNAYRPEVERRRLLDASPGYHQNKVRANDLRSQVTVLRGEEQRLERDLQRARFELNGCQKTAGANCDAQSQRVNELTQQLSAKSAEVRNVESQLRIVQQEVDRVEERVDREVRTEETRLRNILERAQNERDRLAANLSQADGRRRDILQVEIPHLQNRNVYLADQRRRLESDIVYLERLVASASQELKAYDAKVGYQELQRRLDIAEDNLNNARNRLSSLQNEQSRLMSSEIQDQQRLVQLAQNLQNAQSRLAAVEARIGTLNGILAQYDSERQILDSRLSGANAQIQNSRSRYLAHIQ